jgi:hypothetical protein
LDGTLVLCERNATETEMTRLDLFRQLAEDATAPLDQLAGAAPLARATSEASIGGIPTGTTGGTLCNPDARDLFVWFEDTSDRQGDGDRGIAGLPECLLPVAFGMKVVERRYAAGHLHLLTAVRVRCRERADERIAAIYTAALAVGTIAWMGTGSQYEMAWNALYSAETEGLDPR